VLRLTIVLAATVTTLVGLGYLLHLNPEDVTVHLTATTQWKAPLPIVMLTVFLAGVAVMFTFSLVRAGRHALAGWRSERTSRRFRRHQMRKEQGLAFAWLGELDKARATLARALRDRPEDLSAFLLFARTHLDEGDYRRALAVLREGLEKRGHDPKLLLFLAQAQRGLEQLPAAIETLEQARRGDPASPAILSALRDAYVAAGRWTEAGQVQESLLSLLREPEARIEAERWLIGLRYESTLAIADAAAKIAALRTLVRAHPDFEPAAVTLGDVLLEAGQPRQAERVWRRALTRGARAGVLERLERLLTGSPREHRLDALTRRMVQRHPEDGTTRLFRARRLVRAGSLDEAAAELAKVGAPWNTLPGYHALAAELQVRRGAHEDAFTAFRQALAAGAMSAFHCQLCGAEREEWAGFCPTCRSWGSYRSSFEVSADAAVDGAARPVLVAAAPGARASR
jgi:lipopolysaccharide assembly protein B